MAAPSPLRFQKDFDAQTGTAVPVAPGVVRVTAPNGGPYTFTGTNSYLLGESRIAVVDPGPDDDLHLDALLKAVDGRAVEAIILTHTHIDHCALVPKLRAKAGAPLWFAGPHRMSRKAGFLESNMVARSSDWALRPDRVLDDGEAFAVGGMTLLPIATPGHCANHLALGLVGSDWLLSGDHVMGWSSTLVSVPDGSMADYLASLDRIVAAPFRHYLPGHGGPIADGPDYASALKTHREARNGQIVAAVDDGARTIGDLLGRIYPKLGLQLVAAARMTLTAHVEYLADRGLIRARRGLFGWRLAPAG